jgi:ABC-type iron transport system FetAB permease component
MLRPWGDDRGPWADAAAGQGAADSARHPRGHPAGLNQMAGAGIIILPGIMSGQILADTDPLVAAQSQIYLMFLLRAACGSHRKA